MSLYLQSADVIFNFLLIFFEPLAELFVNGVVNLDEAQLHPVQVLVETEAKNLFDRDITEVGEQFPGQPFCLDLVLELAAIHAGDFVERIVEGIDAEKN